MPKVGDKEFSYTDDGMRQAQIYADRTGQKVEYQENNRKFGYQEGGSAGDKSNPFSSYYNYPKVWYPKGKEPSAEERFYSDESEGFMPPWLKGNQENQRKRTFMQKHGSLPERIEEPPSLLDESIRWKLAKQLAGPPQWIKNYQEADQMMKEGYDRYGSSEDHWPAFVRGIKEAWGYQEGGEVNFEPHMMYKKGKSEKADTYREHLNLKNKGWGH